MQLRRWVFFNLVLQLHVTWYVSWRVLMSVLMCSCVPCHVLRVCLCTQLLCAVTVLYSLTVSCTVMVLSYYPLFVVTVLNGPHVLLCHAAAQLTSD